MCLVNLMGIYFDLAASSAQSGLGHHKHGEDRVRSLGTMTTHWKFLGKTAIFVDKREILTYDWIDLVTEQQSRPCCQFISVADHGTVLEERDICKTVDGNLERHTRSITTVLYYCIVLLHYEFLNHEMNLTFSEPKIAIFKCLTSFQLEKDNVEAKKRTNYFGECIGWATFTETNEYHLGV